MWLKCCILCTDIILPKLFFIYYNCVLSTLGFYNYTLGFYNCILSTLRFYNCVLSTVDLFFIIILLIVINHTISFKYIFCIFFRICTIIFFSIATTSNTMKTRMKANSFQIEKVQPHVLLLLLKLLLISVGSCLYKKPCMHSKSYFKAREKEANLLVQHFSKFWMTLD